jgi:hypothetical protein
VLSHRHHWHKNMQVMLLLSAIYFSFLPPIAALCRQFNDLAKAAGARRKRIEVSQMLRFPIADLVAGALQLRISGVCRRFHSLCFLVSLSQHTYCKDIFGTVRHHRHHHPQPRHHHHPQPDTSRVTRVSQAHPIRSRILRAVRLFYDQGLFR